MAWRLSSASSSSSSFSLFILSSSLVVFLFLVSNVSGGIMSGKEDPGIVRTKKELCPELDGASKYTIWATRYDNETGRCYRTGTRGPCGKNMIFYSIANDSVFGECDCNYDIECKSLIYSPVFKECVFAYDQGHCNEGYWLVADKEGKPSCERNLCLPPQKYSRSYKWALYKGRCERLFTAENIHDCKPGEFLWIPKGHRYPVCGTGECRNPHTFVPTLQCELGSKLFHEDRCTRRKGI